MFLSDHASHIADVVEVLDSEINDGCHMEIKDLTVSVHGNLFKLTLNSSLDTPDYEIEDFGPEVSENKKDKK